MSQDNHSMDLHDISYDPKQDMHQRRAIRRAYRDRILYTDAHRKDYLTTERHAVEQNLDIANDLYSKVANTMEATLDSKLLILTSELSTQKARQLKLDHHLFDCSEFMVRVGGFMMAQDAGKMDWNVLGKCASTFMCRAPAFQAMLGPLSVQPKERKQIKRESRKVQVERETRPQVLGKEDMIAQENETTRNVEHVATLLSDQGDGVNLFKFLLNPHSYGQSVENLFHASFLIRDGLACIDTESGEPILFRTDAPTADDYAQGVQKRQFVLHLDYPTWQRLIHKYNIQQSTIPHRQENSANVTGKWYG